MNSYRRGIWAEYYALGFLMLKGYWPLVIRYKTRVGEVDIIVKRGKITIFIEVKYRKKSADGAFAISKQSQSRIRRAAEHYLLENSDESHSLNTDMRFDAVIISQNLLIKHIKNAF